MKRKSIGIFMFFLVLCASLIAINRISTNALKTSKVQVDAVASAMQNGLRIIKSDTNVRIGEIGFITIEGKPGEIYTLRTIYKIGNRTIPVTQWRKIGESGQVTFLWSASKESTAGTYPVTITGGGETIKTTHTVTP